MKAPSTLILIVPGCAMVVWMSAAEARFGLARDDDVAGPADVDMVVGPAAAALHTCDFFAQCIAEDAGLIEESDRSAGIDTTTTASGYLLDAPLPEPRG